MAEVPEETVETGLEGGVDPEELEQLEAQLAADDTPADEVAANGAAKAEEEDSDDDGLEEVEDHLKDAVEGSLRLKRLLSRDEDDQPSQKKRKLSTEDATKKAKVNQLLIKWGLSQDMVVKYVAQSCSVEELDELYKSGWIPDKFHQMKTPCELFARYLGDMKERKMPAGSACDAVSSFKFRWKLDFGTDKVLRALSHKDLRYVLTNYDGTKPLDEVIEEAKKTEPADDNTTADALPNGVGVGTIGRFTRLELIDPLADAAVFGDANLTFAMKLARHRKALGHVGRVIATTFEEHETLMERYKEINDSIRILEDHFAEVYHGVDCTRIAVDPRFKGMEGSLGAVYYNFPHSGAIGGFFDGHPVVNWRHENLMRLFFRALRSYVKPGGYVKVASNMGAVGVRYSYIVGSALENEFLHIETVPFLEWHLHRYGRSYGDKRDVYKRPDAKNNQSYNAQSAERDMVYCFCYAPTGKPIGKQHIKLPPTLQTLKACVDGPFKNLQGVGRDNLAKQLHNRFVTEVSGTHVG
mmetsp:Transcript_17306/g.46149  ORF Transcript_17306/g.46149 Transcript_17306/m.46149 type:complete len:525 (-) Transcript_17306:63-1637(-)|eukprot:CAMPEP_0115232648 /NCGR_PEP_ID=MMETSP0270-20121206/33875_1 /TAXON_ID=71861 /ORGANISM="Scrippsiella trochoidea, Strain CCMP3099" /LENGTH=524 /DNA_ID=CAMNT_0002647349 /DNA_START=49 /DNA_END=1623 /DNA_ORIENTATION=+